jgi:hypothetical protein
MGFPASREDMWENEEACFAERALFFKRARFVADSLRVRDIWQTIAPHQVSMVYIGR